MTVTAATAPAASPRPEPPAKATIGSDFNTFLVMLTAQMKNQDPLNPIEGSDYAVQLATFSGVEQQVRTNTLLEGLVGGLGAQGIGHYATWVGREARSTSPVRFSGAPVTLDLAPAAGADAAVLVTLDSAGAEVAREAVPVSGGQVTWSGSSPRGPLPAGVYSFRLESLKEGRIVANAPAQSYSRITEVQSRPEGPLLVLESGATLAPDKATALRERPGL